MKVEFSVEYFVREGACGARISLALPTKEGSNRLQRYLIAKEDFLFGERLENYWGEYSNGRRVREYEVIEKDWAKLEKRVRRIIEDAVDTLKKVQLYNARLESNKPEPRKEVYEI